MKTVTPLLLTLISSVLSVLVNIIAPAIARKQLRDSDTPEGWTANWVRDWPKSPQDDAQRHAHATETWVRDMVKNPQDPAQMQVYALMDYYAQLILTVVAMFLLCCQALLLMMTTTLPVLAFAWGVFLAGVAAIIWKFMISDPGTVIKDYLPRHLDSTGDDPSAQQIVRRPPRGSLTTLRILSVLLGILLILVQLIASLIWP
jgi:hypothetical protein